MSDRIDKLLTDYYSGVVEMEIAMRKADLKFPVTRDENIGGGKPVNKQSRSLDDILIREDEDTVLNELTAITRRYERLKTLISTFTPEYNQIASLRYNRRRGKHTWVHISLLLHLDEKTCRARLSELKKAISDKNNLF
ncbi:DUF722 domain-containing protein [Leuconostoc citreum]|uniref:DUF722 domain-containing protein n=1 Tax=Leuconostoc citreum TaxID=33964 RepID=UPI0032DF1985